MKWTLGKLGREAGDRCGNALKSFGIKANKAR